MTGIRGRLTKSLAHREADMAVAAEREKVRFASGGTECAAWLYPGSNGACVVMAGGFAVPKEPATDLFARRFSAAGFAVLAFDYRRLGESDGRPRQVVRIREQLADWHAAIRFAATRPGVDPARIAAWGFSASGGHIFPVAARSPGLAAAIAQAPNADGPAATRNAARHQRPLAMLRLTGRGVLDAIGARAGRPPRLVPLAGQPGTVALLTTPDTARDAARALNPGDRYPEGQQKAAPRRRPLCAVPGGPRAGGRGGAVLPAGAPAGPGGRGSPGRRGRGIPGRPGMKQIELSAGTIDYQDTGGGGPVLVLLPGLMMDASLGDGPIADLAADHRCIAPTLPL